MSIHYNKKTVDVHSLFVKYSYKRSSVFDDHLSRPIVTNRLERPTYREMRATSLIPILALHQVGFT